jgi:hypothetical protein
LSQEVSVERPERDNWKICQVYEINIGFGCGQGEQGADQRDAPPLQQKRIAGHAGDDGLQHLEMAQFPVHRAPSIVEFRHRLRGNLAASLSEIGGRSPPRRCNLCHISTGGCHT